MRITLAMRRRENNLINLFAVCRLRVDFNKRDQVAYVRLYDAAPCDGGSFHKLNSKHGGTMVGEKQNRENRNFQTVR